MQKPDETKRRGILDVAGRMFASRGFHAVKLDEVAAEARISKGTVYTYFRDKEDLYVSVTRDALVALIDRLTVSIPDTHATAWQRVERIVTELIQFARQTPHFFQLVRAAGPRPDDDAMLRKRMDLVKLVTATLRDGIAAKEIVDLHPELTAEFILSSARAAILQTDTKLSDTEIVRHILSIIGHGVLRPAAKGRASK